MPIKETLSEKEISELADILNYRGTLSMTAKSYSTSISFVPFVRVQVYTSLDHLAEKYGGSVYEFPIRHDGQTPKSSWSWNRLMMKRYLPLLLPYLNEDKAAKAKLILAALALSKGAGRPIKDKGKLREIFIEIKKLQQPRGRDKFPWEIEDSPFQG
jgi:hypothetical protein